MATIEILKPKSCQELATVLSEKGLDGNLVKLIKENEQVCSFVKGYITLRETTPENIVNELNGLYFMIKSI